MSDEHAETPPSTTDVAPEPPGSDSAPPSERKGCMQLGVVVLVLIVVSASIWFVMQSIAPQPPSGATAPTSAATSSSEPVPAGTTEVPAVVALPQDSAVSALEAAGFIPLATFVETSTATPQSVIAQVPAAGKGLAAGSQVSIAVAKAPLPGPTSMPIPNVYQMSKAQAQSALMSNGLNPVFAEGPSVEAKGVAVTQWPSAQETAVGGRTILVLMSNGQEPQPASVAIPSVVGKTEADAASALAKVGLSSQILRGYNDVEKDTVFAQIPPAGGQIAPKTPIILAVSLGWPPNPDRKIAVPDVAGMDSAAATEALVRAGFVVQQADVRSPELTAGKVVGQLPPAGWSVSAGSITIVSVAAKQ
jgi:eukaryotic-like serine/threonine-protein kinase